MRICIISNWAENKVLLLEAEYFASKCNRNSAKEKYEASIKSARDHGFVHEQGLAYEVSSANDMSFVQLYLWNLSKFHQLYFFTSAWGFIWPQ